MNCVCKQLKNTNEEIEGDLYRYFTNVLGNETATAPDDNNGDAKEVYLRIVSRIIEVLHELTYNFEQIEEDYIHHRLAGQCPDFWCTIPSFAFEEWSVVNSPLDFVITKQWLNAYPNLLLWNNLALQIDDPECNDKPDFTGFKIVNFQDAIGFGNLTTAQSQIDKSAKFGEWYLRVHKEADTITMLNLSYFPLSQFPSHLFQLDNLVVLYLEETMIRVVPAEIKQLSNLEHLSFDSSKIEFLAPEIGTLAYLNVLYLNDNNLKQLPTELGLLSSLRELELKSNQLSHLPTEIGGLSSLNVLGLQNNQLSHLPTEIRGLSSLTHLDISSNQFICMPIDIEPLNLIYLDIADNPSTPNSVLADELHDQL
jgi:Leucine-rich repeat (LRR) protein